MNNEIGAKVIVLKTRQKITCPRQSTNRGFLFVFRSLQTILLEGWNWIGKVCCPSTTVRPISHDGLQTEF